MRLLPRYARLRRAVVAGLSVAVWLVASLAAADWREFLPQAYENGSYLDSYTSYERDHQTNSGRTSWWEDLFFRQKMTLFSNGFSYHPRFIQYRFSIAGALREEDYKTNGVDFGWDTSTGMEYDLTMLVLPEHRYNLEAYARRYEPLFKEQAASQHSNVEYRQGFDFNYRDKPYFSHAGYVHDRVESFDTFSDINRINLDGQYFNRFETGNELGFNAGYTPMWFTTSDGTDGSSAQYMGSNFLNLQDVPSWAVPLRVTSTVTQDNYDQNNPGQGELKNDQFTWYEWATATLPYNFRSDVYYRYQDNHSDAPGFSQSYLNKNLKVDLIHRLYESLDSTYTFRDNDQSSSGGDSTLVGNSLIFNYTKLVPYGRLLINTNLGRDETKTNGTVNVSNESFSGSVPMIQPYVLGQPNVDDGSIIVYLKSPLPPYQLVLLDPSYYTLVSVGNTVGIQVTNLPAQYVVPGTYEFLVWYSYSGDFKLRTDTLGANTRLELFDDRVTPYFGYLNVQTDVLSGTYPGVPLDSTTYTTGLLLRYDGLQVRGEYQKFEWSVSPYEAWRADIQYVRNLDEETNIFVSGSYLNKNYPHGTSQYYSTPFVEETETVNGSVQRQLLERTLFLSVGGSYVHTESVVNTDSSTINASLLWRIGKMDVTVGGYAYVADSSGANTPDTKRDHQFVWMNLRRRLF